MSVGFHVEGKLWLAWLTLMSGLHQSLVTILYERARWKRSTVDGKKSFSIYWPYFAVLGAVHVNDVAKLLLGEDPLGIRSRAYFFSLA